jgi:hypothetical protein
MELQLLDPFGDYETAGYLRNTFQEKDLRVVGHLETAAFEQEILGTVRFLRKLPSLQYEHVTETHSRLFNSLYPWTGQDRSRTAPDIAIVKAGYETLFAHPADVRRATDYALGSVKTKDTSARMQATFSDILRMRIRFSKGMDEPSLRSLQNCRVAPGSSSSGKRSTKTNSFKRSRKNCFGRVERSWTHWSRHTCKTGFSQRPLLHEDFAGTSGAIKQQHWKPESRLSSRAEDNGWSRHLSRDREKMSASAGVV